MNLELAEPRHVIISGAGPGGASLAHVLAAAGVRVTLLERHHDFEREFRGEWLNESGQTALQQMGLGEALAAVPSLEPSGAVVYVNGIERLRMQSTESAAAQQHLLVPQPALLERIVTDAQAFGSFTLHRGIVVRGTIVEDGRIVGVRATRQADGDEIEFRADYVIAADGRASVLRRAVDLPIAVDNGGDVDMLWFKAPVPDSVDPDLGYQFLQRDGTAFCHPHPDGPHQWGWAFTKGTYGELRRRGRDAWIDAMQHHVPEPFRSHLDARKADIDAAFLEIVSYYLATWNVPGLLLIGDAAHPMSAVGGQGINMALRDAVVAANHLGPPLLTGAPAERLDTAAAHVAPERIPEIARIQKLQARGSRILNLQTRSARFMIEQVLSRLGTRAAPILARGVGTTKEFSRGVTAVDLTFRAPATSSTRASET